LYLFEGEGAVGMFLIGLKHLLRTG
jgi:hypothetical protein